MKCEVCRTYDYVMECENCGAKICSACSEVIENDPNDVDTWVIMCRDCSVQPDRWTCYEEGEF